MEEIVFKPLIYSESELNQIVGLIRKSLDPTFTVDFFKWKHLYNPFGNSYGLLAIDGEKIVGLRMFMFWEFCDGVEQNIKTAIRPVDTVVDSNYRGRGLFKKLTLQGLENCKGEYDFVFNTPNNNSLPGYLKMGWNQSANVSNFRIGMITPFQKKPKLIHIEFEKSAFFYQSNQTLQTNKTENYLRWRYVDPKYKIFTCDKGGIVFSLTRIRGFRGLIIHELLGDKKNFNDLLVFVAKENNAYLIYYYNSEDFNEVNFLTTLDRKKAVVVFKEAEDISRGLIKFSLGDLEGKL